MEERYVVAVCKLSFPTGRSAPVTGVHPPRGAGALETTTVADVAHRPGAGLRAGGASAAVGAGLHLTPERGGGRDLRPGTGAKNPPDLSLGPGVVPGPTRGSKRMCDALMVEGADA